MTRRLRIALAGVLAVAAALVATEVVAVLSPTRPSLLDAVQRSFVDTFGGALKDLAVSVFGESHKTALTVGTFLVCLALAPLTARLEVRRRGAGAALLAAFALLGVACGLAHPQSSTPLVLLAGLVGATTGTLVLWVLLDRFGIRVMPGAARIFADRRGPASAPEPSEHDGHGLAEVAGTRREVVLWALGTGAGVAIVGALAKGAGDAGRTSRSPIPASLPAPATRASTPARQPFDVPGLSPYLTPTRDFYKIDTTIESPYVVTDEWTLRVVGMVDREIELSYADLLARDLVEEVVTLACVSNQVGGDLVGNATWAGVPLRDLLAEAGVRSGASQVVGESVDGFTAGFPTSALDDPDRPALVAVGMNGQPLPRAHGFPARLVVAGLYGYVSATKWLSEIRLTTWEDEDGYWIDRGWAKEAPVKTQSRIDVPRRGQALVAGRIAVAGVAWAPNRGISRVEVGVDGAWHEAELGRVSSDDTWVQWHWPWDAGPGDHELVVRATDGTGATQGQQPVAPAPDGAEGWHSRTVRVAAS